MSILRIEERFTVDAPPGLVFEYLSDPERIVGCLPGASIGEGTADGVYHGGIRVGLGPVKVAFRGSLRFTEVDAEAGLMRAEGAGRDKTGNGKLVMESRVLEADGGSEVIVDARVRLAGRIVGLAGRFIEPVARGVFHRFAKCFARMIERDMAEANAPIKS